MTNIKRSMLGISAVAAALCCVAPAEAATVIKTLHPVYPGTISGVFTYTANEKVDFKFTVAAPYHFSFSADSSGPGFPFPIDISASGTAGTYTEVFGPFPVSGAVDYTLTTAVPEPGVWALMVAGFGLVGVSARRRGRAVAA